MSTSDILESLIEKDNGYLITSKAIESGVSKPSVSNTSESMIWKKWHMAFIF